MNGRDDVKTIKELDDYPTVTIEFSITKAEKTIAWFYSGNKQSEYQKNRISMFNVIPNGVETNCMAAAMLFKCRGYLARVVIYSALGAISMRIDDEFGWGRYQ